MYFFFFSAASLSLGTDQSNLHELHVLLFNFTIIIVSVIKIMPMWSDIFLIVFFLLITLFYSSSIYPFPYAFSYGRGEWTLPRSCGCGCTLPWPASMLATCPATNTNVNFLKCLFSFRSSSFRLHEETYMVKRVVFTMQVKHKQQLPKRTEEFQGH